VTKKDLAALNKEGFSRTAVKLCTVAGRLSMYHCVVDVNDQRVTFKRAYETTP
jgi:hypothetical protein